MRSFILKHNQNNINDKTINIFNFEQIDENFINDLTEELNI